MKTLKKIRSPHVLDTTIIAESQSWEECLKEWEQPLSLRKRMEWIHSAQVRSDNGERFPILLELADRHADPELFLSMPGHASSCWSEHEQYRWIQDIGQAKMLLSRLAFRALCNSLFVEMKDGTPSHRPYCIELQEPLFSQLIWFFRCSKDRNEYTNFGDSRGGPLRAIVASKHYEVAKAFACRLAMDAWRMLIREPFYWDNGGPDFAIAAPHTKAIVNLMRKCDHLDIITSGQYLPPPHLFQEMVRIVCEEDRIDCSQVDLTNLDAVGELLEPLVRSKGDCSDNSLAKALYLARLNLKSFL